MNQISRSDARARSNEQQTAPGAAPPAEAHDPALGRRRRRSAVVLGVVVLCAVLAMVGGGIWLRMSRGQAAAAALQTRQDAVPQVHVIQAKSNNNPAVVDLPANMQAFDAATLYARATGYISKRNVDIGTHVKEGDVLALIAAPDLDQQLLQARAQLMQMQAAVTQSVAQRSLANVNNQRTQRLVTEGWSTRQQGDTDRTTYTSNTAGVDVAQANLAAQVAQVNRLVELTGFERVTAPFSGVITARQIDVGNLVTADSNNGTSLFSIAHTDVLRVQVYVPQEYFFGLKDGQDATITVPQLPGRDFHGKVSRNAAALSANTRTLLIEVDVDNQDGALSAGLYGIVHLQVPREQPVFTVPSQAIIFNKDGLNVAVVENGQVAVHKLDIASDDGGQVQVRAGLQDGDQIILSPPANLVPGMKVKVVTGD